MPKKWSKGGKGKGSKKLSLKGGKGKGSKKL